MAKIFKPRRGLKSTMSTTKSNTVLAAGEMFFEIPNGGLNSGPGRIMLGDGVSAYSALTPFMEQTDVSSAQVTVTADNSSTSTAALNNVATGATTGAIVGSLKQAISLTKSELTNTIDDNVSTLQSNFQAGVDSVYNAVKAKGSTPSSKSLSDVVTAINNISTGKTVKTLINSIVPFILTSYNGSSQGQITSGSGILPVSDLNSITYTIQGYAHHGCNYTLSTYDQYNNVIATQSYTLNRDSASYRYTINATNAVKLVANVRLALTSDYSSSHSYNITINSVQ